VNIDDVGDAPTHPLGFAGVDPIDLIVGLHQIRCQNHEQLGALVDDRIEAEQAAQHRNIA
jgi:hypothetical protein